MSFTSILSFNNLSIKEINRHKLFAAIYRNPNLPKQQLAQILDMSLSTIDTNIKGLLAHNLIMPSCTLKSTGGRKATGYSINALSKLALGIFIKKTSFIMTAVSLNGEMIAEEEIALTYEQTPAYFTALSQHVSDFSTQIQQQLSRQNQINTSFLGIALAIQGIVALDHDHEAHVTYGSILDNESLELSTIQQYFTLPCSLYHDSKAAAFAELWEHPNINNAALFLFNENMGGAVIFHNSVHYGNKCSGGLIEHIKVGHEQRRCYCGAYDCLECYCSGAALEQHSGMPFKEFFSKLREAQEQKVKDSPLLSIWDTFLNSLAHAIVTVSKLIDGRIILTGSIASYFTKEDQSRLLKLCNKDNAFPLKAEDIFVSLRSDSVVALGAARYIINTYLEGFEANPITDSKYHLGTIKFNAD